MNTEILKKLQQYEMEILSVFDEFCAKYQIKYSLYAGTALGAIRHKGFIPWDDDIDICMERKEYERFVKLWHENGIEGYFFENPEWDNSKINHGKIRKNGTVLSNKEEIELPGHHGIWIDIFPIDRVPVKSLDRKIFLLIAKIRLVYTRGYTIKNKGKALRILSGVMLLIPRKLQVAIRKRCDNYVKRKWNAENNYALMSLSSPEALGITFPADMLEKIHTTQFGEYQFLLTDKYEEMLELSFGDYMELPPKEEQVCKHNPEIIIFGDEK